MRLVLDLRRDDDGRWEGTVITDAGRACAFSGTLDLLRVLDDLDEDRPAPDADGPGR